MVARAAGQAGNKSDEKENKLKRLGIRVRCAERMKHIQESIKELSKEVKSLRTEVSKGKGAISVLVFLGTVVAGIIGFFQFK